jgi:hypothetical protein
MMAKGVEHIPIDLSGKVALVESSVMPKGDES